ncbi:glycogen/starch/alpha-glucan phosphorylase [cyanobacterium endosymbiont of Rhopalodia gibberula]|uniref:glycogen/starch/alpha-glucan phosphorylase n=1 Tax=cyanobacterium endosymbiont of Rhopalodia gibberula TaxID=1763363 RepID=UPI001558DF91|nr:glycogen/starch/alpha-glucan phosphorylase [cyanobacterium endosymbiont of Rhopalodia gibberula]
MVIANHFLLPEALEKYSLSIFSRLFPGLIEIICEINQQFFEHVHIGFLGNTEKFINVTNGVTLYS